MLNFKMIEEIKLYLETDFKDDFTYSVESRRHEMLEFLEQLMDLGDLANQTATDIIFQGKLGAFIQKEHKE